MGYGKSPWVFKGRALYQLQLVKAEEVRVCGGLGTACALGALSLTRSCIPLPAAGPQVCARGARAGGVHGVSEAEAAGHWQPGSGAMIQRQLTCCGGICLLHLQVHPGWRVPGAL